jgi:hydroxyacylglutathione hydrolase
MRVVAVPCRRDNYAYVVTSKDGVTALVDVSEGPPVLAAVKELGVLPQAIWCTHHHYDHVDGNEEVVRALGVADVYGHASDRGRIPGQTRFLEEGDCLELGTVRVRILHIPGHTTGAIAYVCEEEGERAVFTGDTLFLAGCGRLFEGTPADMFASLAKLAALPPDTQVYCGHEYTLSNVRYARHVEPGNAAVDAYERCARALVESGRPTVPGTLSAELAVNPFLRARDVAELAARRAEKDSF